MQPLTDEQKEAVKQLTELVERSDWDEIILAYADAPQAAADLVRNVFSAVGTFLKKLG